MENVTIEKLQNVGVDSITLAIEWAKSQYPKYPERVSKPTMPTLSSKHTSEDLSVYTKDFASYQDKFKEYEEKTKTYKTDLESYNTKVREINKVIEEYIKEEAGLNDIPEKSRAKVFAKAWQDRHGSGYYEVYLELEELVDLFK